jgi:uncharacterized protein YcfL
MRILPVIAAVTAAFLVVACSSPTPPPGVTVVSLSMHNASSEHGMKSPVLIIGLSGA